MGPQSLDRLERFVRRRHRGHVRTERQELARDDLARVGVVVDEQYAHAAEVMRGRRPVAVTDDGAPGYAHLERQLDDERRPAPLPGALGPDVATVHLDQAARDREAEAEAAGLARRGVAAAPEAFEHALQLVDGNAAARVADDDADTFAPGLARPRGGPA